MKLNLVPARTGIQWVKLGIRTFLRQPLALSGLFFVYMAAMVILSLVPLVGPVLALAITPAATLGLMAATKEAVSGQFPMPTVLVSAFRAGRERLRAMMQLGMIYATCAVLIMALVSLILPVSESRSAGETATSTASAPASGSGSSSASPSASPSTSPPAGAASSPAIANLETMSDARSAMALTLLFHLPLFIAFWFAPALVHWHGVSPVKSLFFSVIAVMRNFWAFAVYGLAWGAMLLVAGFVVSAIALALGSTTAAQTIMLPLTLIAAAMFFTSVYFTFLSCFATDAQGIPTTNPPPPDLTP